MSLTPVCAVGESADRPIGVFDSGIGGLSVLNALRAELPHERFVYLADTAHAPYGERSAAHAAERTLHLAQQLRRQHEIKALVVACNTATAAAIELLRAAHPTLPLVGLEPALKPAAALSRTGHIAVLATRGTLASAKFRKLHEQLAQGPAQFHLVPCDGLAGAIEAMDTEAIDRLCALHMASAGAFGTQPGQIDTVVLGCTHYPLVVAQLRRHADPAVQFIDTGLPVAQQTRRLLQASAQLRQPTATDDATPWLRLRSSGAADALAQAAARWLQPAPTLPAPDVQHLA